MENLLTDRQKNSLIEKLNEQILRRGFNVTIKEFEETETRGTRYINFSTEAFQTQPIIFQEIKITSFSTSLSKEKGIRESDGHEYEITKFWISVNVSYKHFGGGTNGCELFTITGNFYEQDSHLNKFQIR